MLVSNIETKSILYRTLQTMGLLFTDDHYVRTNRAHMYDSYSFDVPISNEDIYVPAEDNVTIKFNGESIPVSGWTGFYGSIVSIHKCEYPDLKRDSLEISVNGKHYNACEINWVENEVYLHAVLPDRYDEYDEDGKRICAMVRIHTGVFRRYSVVAASKGSYVHTASVNFAEPGAVLVQNPYYCLFYYADGVLGVPTEEMITRKSDTVYEYRIPYDKTLDAFWCWNMVAVHRASANITFNLHSPELKVTYPRIFVDDSEEYPINTLFYPTVRVDKDCIVRVFADMATEVPHPEISRILLYPEFLDVDDPYNTDNEYLNSLEPCDVVITDEDDDETTYQKFMELAPYFYRIGDGFPRFSDEQSDFLMLDNRDWEHMYIEPRTITRLDGSTEDVLMVLAPYEGFRDIMFYDGSIYSDYKVVTLDGLTEDPNGTPYYVIHDLEINPDRLTLLKFNTAEDTVINNLGEWIDTNQLLDLHTKVNRLYRNLLVLRGEVNDEGEDYAVRISASEPPETDRDWLEILSSEGPGDIPNIIELLGLDLTNLPEDLAKALDALKVNSEKPSEVYYYIMMTYIVHEAERRHIPIEMVLPEGAETSRYTSIQVSPLIEKPLPNDVVLEVGDSSTGYENPITEYYTGHGLPMSSTYDADDVYINEDETDELLYMDANGNIITLETISHLDRETKENVVTGYITDGTDEEIEEVKSRWNEYLDGLDENKLNAIVYIVLRTAYFVNTYGSIDALTDGEVPKEEAIHHNLEIIISKNEPTDPTNATAWVNTPNITVQDYINSVLLQTIYENYPGLYDDVDLEELVEFLDVSAHTVHYGETAPDDPHTGDVWYEFIKDVHNKVCYSDENAMVLNINENLVLVEFDHDNITAFAFDDILMNFKGRMGIRYLSIVADLINSGVISKDQINIFYHRLITGSDQFDPKLARLYDGRSHVVVTANVDTSDLGILYSTNIGRLHIDYSSEDVTNREREWVWRRHVIDYRRLDVSFIPDRMMLFVNGKFITPDRYLDGFVQGDTETLPVPGMLQLTDFDEIISTVDILYAKKDLLFSRLKRSCIDALKQDPPDVSVLTHPARDYGEFQPIINVSYTKRGFYDVLLEEYILNGRLMNNLQFLKDHPEAYEDFRNDMVSFFHMISDVDLCEDNVDLKPRIIIPCFGTNQVYQIGTV